MNGRIATAGSNSEAPSETSTAPGVMVCSKRLLASSWNNDGTAQRIGTTASNSMISAPLQVPTLDESSAPAADESVPINRPATIAATLASISNSTEMPKPVGSPALSSNSARKPGV